MSLPLFLLPAFFLPFFSTTEPFSPPATSLSMMLNAMVGKWSAGAIDARSREEREECHWIARARTGDEAAYRWLLGRYRTRVVRLAAHILRREGDAEDVAQEAFLKAFQRLSDYKNTGRFSAWLFQIVVRLCLDRRRAACWKSEVPTAAVSIAIHHDAHDTRLLIEALLDQLSPPMRAALVLREIEGFEYDEIAEALSIPIGTVRSRLNTARTQFRTLWTAAQEDTPNG